MDIGFEITPNFETMEFLYGPDVFGPKTEKRRLDDIRQSLSNPEVDGPDVVYSVAMDVGNEKDAEPMKEQNLLYGAMIFSGGVVGDEPVRSQGHIHAVSPSCQASTCEVYEIWSGEAYIYMQEFGTDNPGRCFAVHGKPKDVIVVPPGWVHATIVADPSQPMTFGAWCVRDYGFEYEAVRSHHGIAWFPKVVNGKVIFEANSAYQTKEIKILEAREYPEFGIEAGIPIYKQWKDHPNRFDFVAKPQVAQEIWNNFKFE